MRKLPARINTFLTKHFDFRRYGKKLGLSKADYFRLLRYPGGYSEPTSITFNGTRTHFTSPFWFLHSIQEIFIDEVYKFLPSRPDPTIIDCGANIGLSAIYFKTLCPDANILAFEADPSVYELLRKNLEERKLRNVDARNNAVWIDDSFMQFEAEGALGGKLAAASANGEQTIGVKGVRLRDFLDTRIDFLKIDIEGAEYEVLRDCRDKLTNVENLFVEYHVSSSEPQRLDEILAWCSEAGFRYYISEASTIQPHPFVSKRGDVFDLQLNISCYRPGAGAE